MIKYGAPNPDPCPSNPSGHYCQHVGTEWVCTYCGAAIKTYTGPSIMDEAVALTEGK